MNYGDYDNRKRNPYTSPQNRTERTEVNNENIKKVIEYIKSGINSTSDESSIFRYQGLVNNMFTKDLKSNQLRKFYSEVVEIYQDVHTLTNSTVNKALINTRLAMMEPRAYYSKQRNYVTEELFEFIKQSVKLIIDAPDPNTWRDRIERFKLVFEAIIAYSSNKGGS